MDYTELVIQSLLTVFRPECCVCNWPILKTEVVLQNIKTMCVRNFVFETTCIFCNTKGEVIWDLKMREEPRLSKNLLLAKGRVKPLNIQEVLEEAMLYLRRPAN